jgi:hypothetical protein
MTHLLIIGAILLSGHGHLTQPQPYFWPAMNRCVLTTGTDRHGVWHAKPFIQCTPVPAHFAKTPPPPIVGGISPNSPQAAQFNQNYCPLKPDGYCTPPAIPVNITPDYQGN